MLKKYASNKVTNNFNFILIKMFLKKPRGSANLTDELSTISFKYFDFMIKIK
jgi:hypothetical protein